MALQLPKIYPITDARLSGLSHAEQADRLIAGGARLIQLREKHTSSRDYYAAAERVIAFARPLGVKIIINDRVDIALVLRADGVHLGQDDLPPEHAREILGPDSIIGLSTHSVEQAVAAARLPVDYIAIGPIFGTRTKENPDPVVGLEGLRRVREALGDFPLVAIGGITGANVAAILGSYPLPDTRRQDASVPLAHSAAIIGALVSDPDAIAARFAEFSSFNFAP